MEYKSTDAEYKDTRKAKTVKILAAVLALLTTMTLAAMAFEFGSIQLQQKNIIEMFTQTRTIPSSTGGNIDFGLLFRLKFNDPDLTYSAIAGKTVTVRVELVVTDPDFGRLTTYTLQIRDASNAIVTYVSKDTLVNFFTITLPPAQPNTPYDYTGVLIFTRPTGPAFLLTVSLSVSITSIDYA